MPRYMRLIAPAAIAVLASSAMIMLPVAPVRAADCLAAPNAAAPDGSHWYYRTDRVKRRKCWYLGSEDGSVRRAARRPALQTQSPATPSRPEAAAPEAAAPEADAP